jgi:hypothetical protein
VKRKRRGSKHVHHLPSQRWAYDFVNAHRELRIVKVNPMEEARLNNIWFENLAPFLLDVEEFIEKKKIIPSLIFQLDETSCLLSRYRFPGRVCSAVRHSIPCESPVSIYRCTLLFVIQGDGEHLKSHMLLPSKVDPAILGLWKPTKMHIHYTENGWMEKRMFEEIISTYLLKAVYKIRATLSSGEEKSALLLCDGHSSRMNLPLMRELARQNVEVGILPAHSSSVTQPLDLCPNAQFKAALARSRVVFPSGAKLQTDLKKFVDQIQDAAEAALLRPNIKKGWERSGLIWGSMEEKLKSLDLRPPGVSVEERSRRFTISGHWITQAKFLEQWTEHESRRDSRHDRRKKERARETERVSNQRKRRKLSKDDEDYICDEVGNEVVAKSEIEKGSEVGGGEKKEEKTRRTKASPDKEAILVLSEESTTDSDMRDEYLPLNPVNLRYDLAESEVQEIISPSELQEIRVRILDEHTIHPRKRERKPKRFFSPDPPLTKTKRSRTDIEDSPSCSSFCEKTVEGSGFNAKQDHQYYDILSKEMDEEEEICSTDSDYTE